jgi:hypothetical protein
MQLFQQHSQSALLTRNIFNCLTSPLGNEEDCGTILSARIRDRLQASRHIPTVNNRFTAELAGLKISLCRSTVMFRVVRAKTVSPSAVDLDSHELLDQEVAI